VYFKLRNYVLVMVLASESQCTGQNTPSVRSLTLVKETMTPHHWLGLVFSFNVLALVVGW